MNTRIISTILLALGGLAVVLATPRQARALDDEHWRLANASIEQGIDHLRATQNEDGSWSPDTGPAITALVVRGMLSQPNISSDDPQIAKAIDYILASVQDDGGIYRGILPNYNTSICLSALALVRDRPGVPEAIAKAQAFLRGIQWDGQVDPNGKIVDESHPFYGGAGYGKHGRPDMSNTITMLQGLHDSGLDCNDPAFQRAVVFIARCQGIDSNDLFAELIDQDGGFIYATSINKDLIGVPESKANPEEMDEAKLGKPVSGLRTYGSMTYAGFKSYLYANLDRDDPRVAAALNWIGNNYTMDRNPGMPATMDQQGLFYYYLTAARALDAYGATTIDTADGATPDWANDLIAALVERQADTGAWANPEKRWMEGNTDLATAYAILALQAAIN